MPYNANDEWVTPSPRDLMFMVRERVERYPNQHDQGSWIGGAYSNGVMFADIVALGSGTVENNHACGTTGCTAGWAVFLGEDPASKIRDASTFRTPDGVAHDVAVRAQELLGLDRNQAAYLFSPLRSQNEVVTYLTALIANQGAQPPVVTTQPDPTTTYHVLVMNDSGEVLATRHVKRPAWDTSVTRILSEARTA